MVWVVEGTMQSPPGVEVETLPEVSSHWLRPVRKYRVGRAGGIRAPPQPGSDKLGAPSRARLYDFRVASLKVSKDGLIDFETGGDKWEPLYKATAPRNLDPYPIVAIVHNSKKCKLLRKNATEPVALEPDSSGLCRVTVKDGDRFEQDQFFFELKWVPIVICFAAARADQKPALSQFGKAAGIKLDYGEPRADHTHYVVRKATPNKHLLSAAMRTMHVVSAAWYQDFKLVCTAPDFPPADQLLAHPGDRQEDEDPAAYDKRWQKYEREVLALDPDAGADTARWWSHSLLENDWASGYPLETDEKYFPIPFTEMDDRDKWIRKDGRKTLFSDILVASFSGKLDNNDWQGRLLSLGGGHFFASSILQTAPLPNSASQLVDAIETYRTDAKVKSDAKMVIIPPDGLFDDAAAQRELDEQSAQQKDLLLDLQEQTNASIISSSAVELAEAIASVSLDPLLNGPPRSPELRPAPPTGNPMSSIGLPEQTLPFPSCGVPGTHPDSVYPTGRSRTAVTETQRSRADATQAQPGSEAGPSGARQQQAPAPEQAPSAPKKTTKLVRRARAGHTAVLDLLEDRDEDAAARSTAPRYLTQDLGAKSSSHPTGTRGVSESLGVDDDEAMQSSAGTSSGKPRHGRLNRRAGQQKCVLQAWLDDDDLTPAGDADMGDSGSGTSQGRAARQAKSKEERMREIREEDDRRAKQEAELHEKRKQQEEEERKAGGGRRLRAVGAAAHDDHAVVASRQKRAKATATDESGSDSATSDQPARKRTSKKAGAAPIATTNKRTRAMSRAPDESSSGGEGGERGGRKKSRGPPADESAQTKKEATAQRKAAKEQEAVERERLLQVKTSKRKGAELDKALNDEFNALRIVKPVIKPMPKPERARLGWEEEDSDVERDRLIHADQERLEQGASDNDDEMDPNRWRQATQAMFVIKPLYLEAHARRNGDDHGPVDPKWAGSTNFKRFRRKNAAAGRPAPPERVQIQLVLPEAVDYGLGEGYNDRKGAALRRTQHAEDDDEDDADTFSFAGAARGQTKLTFGAKKTVTGVNKSTARGGSSKAKSTSSKTKAKSKRIVTDSDEESAGDSSNTLNGTGMDIDELDDDNAPLQPAPIMSKRGATSTAAAGGRSGSARASSRKAAPATIMIDDSDSDSDSGLTFKGFGKKGGRL